MRKGHGSEGNNPPVTSGGAAIANATAAHARRDCKSIWVEFSRCARYRVYRGSKVRAGTSRAQHLTLPELVSLKRSIRSARRLLGLTVTTMAAECLLSCMADLPSYHAWNGGATSPWMLRRPENMLLQVGQTRSSTDKYLACPVNRGMAWPLVTRWTIGNCGRK